MWLALNNEKKAGLAAGGGALGWVNVLLVVGLFCSQVVLLLLGWVGFLVSFIGLFHSAASKSLNFEAE